MVHIEPATTRSSPHRFCSPLILATLLGSGCATTGDDGPCAACQVTFDTCRREDDYDACRVMQRYCLGWCADAASCAQVCDGAEWGCQASPLRRTTCDATDAACRARCPAASDARRKPSGTADRASPYLDERVCRPEPAADCEAR